MRTVADSGATVLLSSHLLSEVKQVCDSVTIVARGRHVRSGRVTEVLAGQGTGEIRVGLADRDAGVRVLSSAGVAVRVEGDHLVVSGVDDAARVTRQLADAGLYVRELVPVRADLESVFLELTGTRGTGVPVGVAGEAR